MRPISPVEIARVLWRRKLWILIPSFLGIAAALVVIRVVPPLYRAGTMILVEPQKVPADYVRPTVTTSLQDRLKTIEQQITNRGNLERIINEFDLYPELRNEVTSDSLVAKARRNLTVEVRGGALFRVHFRGPDPVKVAAVANRVAELFIEENLKLRENQALGTSAFLEAELEAMKEALEAQEAKVATFRLDNEGFLPEQRQSNLAALAQFQTRLEMNRDKIGQLELRRLLLQRDLKDERATGAPPPATRLSRLQELRLRLLEARSRYTDSHPDVIRLRQEVAALEQLAPEAPAAGAPDAGFDPLVKAELDSIDLELARLRTEEGRILGDIDKYQNRLERMPRVELELVSLTRDYDNLKSSYESLLGKRINARLAENLEKRRQSEQFTILERAAPPGRPYYPNRPLFLALGLLGGAVIGLGLVFIREETDQSFADAAALQQEFPSVDILASVPMIKIPRSRAAGSGRGAA